MSAAGVKHFRRAGEKPRRRWYGARGGRGDRTDKVVSPISPRWRPGSHHALRGHVGWTAIRIVRPWRVLGLLPGRQLGRTCLRAVGCCRSRSRWGGTVFGGQAQRLLDLGVRQALAGEESDLLGQWRRRHLQACPRPERKGQPNARGAGRPAKPTVGSLRKATAERMSSCRDSVVAETAEVEAILGAGVRNRSS
jgi:hypothetical protein